MTLSHAQSLVLTTAARLSGQLSSRVWLGGQKIVYSTIASLERRGLVEVRWDVGDRGGREWISLRLTADGWDAADPDGLVRLRMMAQKALTELHWQPTDNMNREDCEALIRIANNVRRAR